MSDLDSKTYKFSGDDQLARFYCPKTEALAKDVAEALEAAGIPVVWFRGLRGDGVLLEKAFSRADVAYADAWGFVHQVCAHFPEVLARGQLEAHISHCVRTAKESA